MTSHQTGQKVKWMESTSVGRTARKTPKWNPRVGLKVYFSSLNLSLSQKNFVKHRSEMLIAMIGTHKKKGFYGLKWICPQQDDKISEFFVEVPAVCESAPFCACPLSSGRVRREEQLQMARFRKPRAQKGSLSDAHVVYKLQRPAAVCTPLWKQLK